MAKVNYSEYKYKPFKVKAAKTVYNSLKRLNNGVQLTAADYVEFIESVRYGIEDIAVAMPHLISGNEWPMRESSRENLYTKLEEVKKEIGNFIPEIVEMREIAATIKSYKEDIFSEADRYANYFRYEKIEECPSNVTGEELASFMKSFAGRVDLTVEELYNFNVKNINVETKSEEHISISCRTSIWSTDIFGTVDLGDRIVEHSATKTENANRI